jgi:hypothetical protein
MKQLGPADLESDRAQLFHEMISDQPSRLPLRQQDWSNKKLE